MRTAALVAAFLTPMIAAAQVEQGAANADFAPAFEGQTRAPALPQTAVEIEQLVSGLRAPWGIAQLPGDGFLVTEREGRMRLISDGAMSEPIGGLPEVAAIDQGGLLDVAVRTDFADTRQVWWTYAAEMDGGYITAAATGVLDEESTEMTDVRVIFEQNPPSQTPKHYGSRIVFGPDGMAYITTGEHSSQADRVLAQDITTTYGKVIRISPEGDVPDDNPFVGTEGVDTIWSYGHRNIQGADFAADGTLWTMEHGPRGGDELNAPQAGANYGWPIISYGINYDGTGVGSGEAVRAGMEQPVYYWDPVIAPGGIDFYEGTLFDWGGDLLIAGLNPGALVRLSMEDGRVTGEERLLTDVGRIRDVEVLRDGSVLVLIDAPNGGILRMTPAQ
ncbi:soluble aldose sugar dehydrogenase YliI [Octadecabacter antarcticus 307]|uniref:Soluble aldose sugar dehydrogenase YliI n=2 Tax=Octadecabacter TaxID=53945 RepID=M9RDU4_9RHOB|nr:soluble aldose sugar dehydrogenase YliI [Octadecabacter antarcticus 307]